MALAIALLRLRTYDEPINRDLATYAMAAREFLGGRELYTDLWDHKPPAIFWTYALAQRIVGDGQQTFYFLIVVTTILTMLGTYAAASAWSRSRGWITGLMAAAAWTIVGGTLPLQANEPNTEPFINACVVWAFALLLRLRDRLTRRRWAGPALVMGLLLGWASLYKTVVVAHAFVFGLSLLLLAGRRGNWRLRAAQVAAVAAAAAAPWAAVLALFYSRGAGPDFMMAVFTYNLFYAGQIGSGAVGNILQGLHPEHLLPRILRSWLPLLGIALVGFALGRPLPRRLRWPALALLLYGAASHAAMAMPGQFAPHYYQYLGPPLCIGGAWGLFLLQRRFPPAQKALPLLLLMVLLLLEAPSYFFSAGQWARRKYGPDPEEERRLGVWLNSEILQPGESVYQWGSALPLLYAANRPLPSGIFFIGPVLGGPMAETATQRLLRDLERTRPELLLMDVRDVPSMPRSPIEHYFRRNYVPLGRDPRTGRFLLLARKGSSLEARRNQILPALKGH